jgi:hypothetical protein
MTTPEIHPCDQHRTTILTIEWHRALQIADDCDTCEVTG